MQPVYAIHIAAGVVGLLSGFIALYAAKGGRLHRKSGKVFVSVMLTTCTAGLAISVIRNVAPTINVTAALLTAYLVVTSLTTVRPVATAGRALHVGGLIIATAVALTNAVFAVEVFTGRVVGIAFPFIMFGTVGLLAAVGDARVMITGPLRGVSRLARHLWRMCFALFIAALSFFVGQAKVFPEPIRIMPLLALPMLAVIATMFYWLWRIRIRRSVRGIVMKAAPSPASAH